MHHDAQVDVHHRYRSCIYTMLTRHESRLHVVPGTTVTIPLTSFAQIIKWHGDLPKWIECADTGTEYIYTYLLPYAYGIARLINIVFFS